MAKGNLQRCLEQVWPFEGGYVDHPKDPGGATNMGITFNVLQRWRGAKITKQDVRDLTKAEAQQIYAQNYARPLRFDDLPIGPDLVTLDLGINSGVDRSARYAQAVAGVAVDGKIGPITLLAIQKMPARDYVKNLCAKRLSFVQGLKIWDTFGKGWSRRIAHMEATALSWVSSKPQLEQDAKAAANKAAGQGGGALVTVGTGSADQVNGLTGLPIGVVIATVVIVTGVLVIRTVINAQRASALNAVAKDA